MTKIAKPAATAADLNPLIANRFSPRIYDNSHELTDAELTSLAEAFRWAPSSNNQQPWRLVIARRGTEVFNAVAQKGLTGFNQAWAPAASAFAIVLAKQLQDGKERDKAATFFDAGLASQQLVLQAEHQGLKAHYMGGILRDEILAAVGGGDHWVICVITLGIQGDLEGHEEAIIERERAQRTRLEPDAVYSIDAPLS